MADSRPLSISGDSRNGPEGQDKRPHGEVRSWGVLGVGTWPPGGRLMRSARPIVLLLVVAAHPTLALADEPFATFRALRWEPPALAFRYSEPAGAARRDYRWVGTAAVGIGLGTAAVFVTRAACGNSENGPRDCTAVTIGAGLLGAAAGGVIGNLLGRLILR
jgi:hypothetical protein